MDSMDSQNITFRKLKLTKSTSIHNISESSTMFDTTAISLPEALNESQTIIELNQKIEDLTSELQSANHEIENLNNENLQLKQDIDKCHKVINMYKKLNLSDQNNTPITAKQTKKKKSSSTTTPIRFSTPIPTTPVQSQAPANSSNVSCELIDNIDSNKAAATPDKIPLNTEEKSPSAMYQSPTIDKKLILNTNRSEIEYVKRKHSKEEHCEMSNQKCYEKRKILIIADQRGRGLRMILQNLVGTKYVVSCFMKPFARMAEILHCPEINTLNANDYIIILGGMNDVNPYEFQWHLTNFFQNAKLPNILVSEIPFNK